MDGKRLAKLRKAVGLTQVQLANAAGVDPSLVSRIERGEVTKPAITTVQALARALRVTLDELAADPDPVPAAKAVGE
jgi:HTH-type transcriptional repressor of puuD